MPGRPLARSVAGRAQAAAAIAGHTVRRSRRLDLATHAVAFGAQQLLCTVPLVVAISAVVPHGPDHGVGYATIRLFGLHGSSASAVSQLLARPHSSISVTALALSAVTALVFSTSVGAVQQRAFELIWSLPPARGLRPYLRQLAWAPTLAVFTVAVLGAAAPGRWLDRTAGAGGDWLVAALRVALVTAFYGWTQYWLLDRRVPMRRLLPGAALVGVAGVLLVEVSRLVVPGQIAWQLQAYGLIGVGIVLATWLMVLSAVIFAGILTGAVIAVPSSR